MSIRSDMRTHYEACIDVVVGQRIAIRHERLNRRLRMLFNFLNLFGGSGAFAGAVAGNTVLTATCGVALAAVSALDFVLSPGERSWAFTDAAGQYARLRGRMDRLTLEELDHDLRALQALPGEILESLRYVAFNDALQESGRTDEMFPLSRWQRFMRSIA
ncbi:hypothetical protein [Chromobacterium violaceum]|uniref:SMODS and SLOG-associating 2TM effector domain-containing protein n=1 Tax=Chromobacterium violaceum TaxID=536 RepID=A0A202B5L5_CHRVL|nr:hypothetical protein [Chromobacterium violaceum]OVE46709.1 hypothetical protein CBW21_17585 [Chromobacterium violaceum]